MIHDSYLLSLSTSSNLTRFVIFQPALLFPASCGSEKFLRSQSSIESCHNRNPLTETDMLINKSDGSIKPLPLVHPFLISSFSYQSTLLRPTLPALLLILLFQFKNTPVLLRGSFLLRNRCVVRPLCSIREFERRRERSSFFLFFFFFYIQVIIV